MTTADRNQTGVDVPTLPGLLNRDLGHLDGLALLGVLIKRVFPGRIALLSSFGAEAAVLLHMVARIDRATPVLFLDTGKLFAETLAYRHDLSDRFGLTDVRDIKPEPRQVAALDAGGDLWRRNPDACCGLRKVAPLQAAANGFGALITGRKRFHGGLRGDLSIFDTDGERVSVNPLARWSAARIRVYMTEHDLPAHPLRAMGYLSIGCAPCTAPVGDGADARTGRWLGREKTECGIHFASGRAVRGAPSSKTRP